MKLFSSVLKFVDENLPKILTIGSMVGVAVTTGTAIKATFDISKKEEKKPLDYVKSYALPAVSGVLTLAGIYGLNHVHVARYTALAGMYALSQSDLKTYKEKAEEFLGVEKKKEIDKACEENRRQTPIYVDSNRETTVLDTVTGRYFASTILKIEEAATKTNQLIVQEGRANLNDFYKFLGLDEVELGDLIQWHQGDVYDVVELTFGSDLTRDYKPIMTISYNIQDHYSW